MSLNRKFVGLLLIFLVISLACLGVRGPWQSGLSSASGKPKPRLRAIVKNQIKTCKQVLKDFSSLAAVIERPVAESVCSRHSTGLTDATITFSPTLSGTRSSRAPPFSA